MNMKRMDDFEKKKYEKSDKWLKKEEINEVEAARVHRIFIGQLVIFGFVIIVKMIIKKCN